MTKSEIVEQKLVELEEIKSNLYELKRFNDPNTSDFFYSNKKIEAVDDFEGMNILGVGRMMETMMSTIIDYSLLLSKTPYSVIPASTETSVRNIILDEENGSPPTNMDRIGQNLRIEELLFDLPSSKVVNGLKGLEITSTKVFDSADRSTHILHELIVSRVNARKNILETYRSGSGDFSLVLGSNELNLDDIYIVSIKTGEQIDINTPYYLDFGFDFKRVFNDDTFTVDTYSVGDRGVGVQLLDVDTDSGNGIKVTTILGHQGLSFSLEDSNSIVRNVIAGLSDLQVGGKYSHNILMKLSQGIFSLTLSSLGVSVWENAIKSSSFIDSTYSLFRDNSALNIGVSFQNIRPLHDVIMEAIDEL